MSAKSADYLDAIEHLPEGATLVFHQYSWEDYERLLNDLQDRPHLRVSYDCGKLEIMSPLPEHEEYSTLIEDLVRVFSYETGVKLEKRGRAIWKKRQLAKGVEPDACYYVASADRVIGKRTIDLASDPPPDIVVEIDITNESKSKFPIYAALSVPEVWLYDGKKAQFFELTSGGYVEATRSRFLPGLTSRMLAESIDLSKTQGQTQALEVFRQRIRDRNSE